MKSALTRVFTILIVLSLLLGGLALPAAAAGGKPGPVTPFPGSVSALGQAGAKVGLSGATLKAVTSPLDATAALLAGANYLQQAQADVTEDNAGNGSSDTDPDDAGWDWSSIVIPHSAAASPKNLFGVTALGLLRAYQKSANAGWMTAMQDAATAMIARADVRTASDIMFLLEFQGLYGVTPAIYEAAAKAKYDGRIAEKGSATAFAQYLRDQRGVTEGTPNGIIGWDIGAYAVAAQMLDARYPGSGYAQQADDIAEVLYQDSFNHAPGLFDVVADAGWDPTWGNVNYWWYNLGISGLIDAFRAANVHTDKIPGLVQRLKDSQASTGAFCGSYGVHPNDEDWQSTAYAVMSLGDLDAGAYQQRINQAASWLASTQNPNGAWTYSDGTHYPEVGGENAAALSYASGGEEQPVWTRYSSSPVLIGSSVQDGCVIKDSGTYQMWYWLRDDQTIWYADSTDGINWTNKHQVLTSSGDETMIIEGPAVIKEGPTSYKMWYNGRDSVGIETIRYATSTDGINWTKLMDSVIPANPKQVLKVGTPGSWDSLKLRNPWVIKDSGTYKMWYSGCAIWPAFKIGYAESSDGITWVKNTGNPIFTGTPDGWDAFQVYGASVVKDGSTYHMYFSGTDNEVSGVWSTGYATSNDGIAWVEAARNPIMAPAYGDSLDFPSVLNDGGTWKMWYSQLSPLDGHYSIFLATLGTATELYLDPVVASIRNDGSATQAYVVRLANAVDLYGYQFVLTYDPTKIEAVPLSAAFDYSFFQGSGTPPPAWDAVIDASAGKVYFANNRTNPDAAVTGSGPLATVTFRSVSGASAGRYQIGFEQVKLGNRDADLLACQISPAWLTLYGVGTLSGDVDLQGRGNEEGAVITIVSSGGYAASTTTIADGTWSFVGIPAGAYSVSAEMARYLDAKKGDAYSTVAVPAGSSITLALVKLLGGDVNDNDEVEIGDMSAIGGDFGKAVGAPPLAAANRDINNDGTINILDLVLAAGNYGKFSVTDVPWL